MADASYAPFYGALPCFFKQLIQNTQLSFLKGSSPAAYPHFSTNALDDLQHDYTTVLHQTLAHPMLRPSNLGILPHKKAWLLSLDVTILSDAGNAYDVIFMAARAALWDTKVPRTRGVQYTGRQAPGTTTMTIGEGSMDVNEAGIIRSGFDTRAIPTATDFELPDYWDEGETLVGREAWPICVTLNIVSNAYSRPCFMLDLRCDRIYRCITWMLCRRKKWRHRCDCSSSFHSRLQTSRVCRECVY
jgi:hypothetical protein